MKKYSNNIESIDIYDELYPLQLKNIPTPPEIIYCKGNIEVLKYLERSISVVGTRHPDKYGIDNTKYFGGEFVKNDILIVSGLALGIDSLAHIEAVKMNKPTIAVLPCSIDNIYPYSHKNLAEEILNTGGLLLSEYEHDVSVNKKSFKRRNRIIAGLTPCTIVIQSKIRSGSLITARYAFEFDREVFAIPGDINNQLTEGTNYLISEEQNIASLVTKPEDVLKHMNWI